MPLAQFRAVHAETLQPHARHTTRPALCPCVVYSGDVGLLAWLAQQPRSGDLLGHWFLLEALGTDLPWILEPSLHPASPITIRARPNPHRMFLPCCCCPLWGPCGTVRHATTSPSACFPTHGVGRGCRTSRPRTAKEPWPLPWVLRKHRGHTRGQFQRRTVHTSSSRCRRINRRWHPTASQKVGPVLLVWAAASLQDALFAHRGEYRRYACESSGRYASLASLDVALQGKFAGAPPRLARAAATTPQGWRVARLKPILACRNESSCLFV